MTRMTKEQVLAGILDGSVKATKFECWMAAEIQSLRASRAEVVERCAMIALDESVKDPQSPDRSWDRGYRAGAEAVWDKLRALPEAQDGGWCFDMSRAPKDRPLMLLARETIFIGKWEDDRYNSKPKPYWHYSDVWRKTGCRAVPPTAWRPLPAPPSKEASDEG